jgi:PIN domain nuclease of toxin-antitoxin system
MKALLDTHILLWAAATPERLPHAARALIDDAANEILFSAASLWEIAIKNGLGRADFKVDPGLLRQGLLASGYTELAISGPHVVAVDRLSPIHRDPFDRLLVAQAMVEDITLITADTTVGRYPGPVRLV